MRIIPGAYKEEANWQQYVTLPSGGAEHNVNRIFLYRIAAFGRDHIMPNYNIKITFSSIFRTMETQIRYWKNATAESRSKGKVAFPGTSWHGTGCAADLTSTTYSKSPFATEYNKFKKSWNITSQDIIYNQYGFAFCVKEENWHIQPVETFGFKKETSDKTQRQFYLHEDDLFMTASGFRNFVLTDAGAVWERKRLYVGGNDVKYLQRILSLPETGYYDELTSSAVREFQIANGLTVDGSCGQTTWQKILAGGNVPPFKAYYPSASTSLAAGGPSLGTISGGALPGSSGPINVGGAVEEDIMPREWTNYYTGEAGVQATLYLERIKNLEIQERRAEEISIAKDKADYNIDPDYSIEDTEAYSDHIEKWETILNSMSPNTIVENPDQLLYQDDSPYATADTDVDRDSYINTLASKTSANTNPANNPNYMSFLSSGLLRDRIAITSLDADDVWAGYARKDVLNTLYLLLLELDHWGNKNGKSYSKLIVSLARNNEMQKPAAEQSLEHYTGIAADIYLPKSEDSVIIIEGDVIVDILFSMGIKNIGIAKDYIHFDIGGNTENVWYIDADAPKHKPSIRTLITAEMEIPGEFL